jgi:hypothetical protein
MNESKLYWYRIRNNPIQLDRIPQHVLPGLREATTAKERRRVANNLRMSVHALILYHEVQQFHTAATIVVKNPIETLVRGIPLLLERIPYLMLARRICTGRDSGPCRIGSRWG